MIILTVLLASSIIFLYFCYWYQTRSRYAQLLNKFPPVKTFVPIFGHIFTVSRNQDKLFQECRAVLRTFKETFSAWGGIYGTLHIITADDAEIILTSTKHIDKGYIYELFESWLGTGLLTGTGKKWHQRRKLLTPAFHYNILQVFVKIFGEHSNNLVKKLHSLSKEEKTDIIPLLSKLTLATICETSMGIKLDENDKLISTYYDSIHKFAKIMVERVFSPWLYPNIIYFSYIFPLSWKEYKVVEFLHKFTRKFIKAREETFDFSELSNLESNPNAIRKKRLAMLDLLIYSKRFNEIDDEGMREEVDTFVFEGFDTTNIALKFSFLLLANHKDIQKNVIAELDEIFGKSDRNPTFDDLQNMKYLECCIKESLRLYPSVPIIIRKIREDVPLTHHVAPAGTEVFIHIYNIHRDAKYFPEPEKFNPDRFLQENIIGRHPFTYIPFSAGPRNCIGQKFAMLELKSVISTVLRNFTMEPVTSPKDMNYFVDLVLRTQGEAYVKFNPRN